MFGVMSRGFLFNSSLPPRGGRGIGRLRSVGVERSFVRDVGGVPKIHTTHPHKHAYINYQGLYTSICNHIY